MTEKDKLMLEEMMINTNAEELNTHAKIVRGFYLAYKGQGFTDKQSLELVKQLIDSSFSRFKQPPV